MAKKAIWIVVDNVSHAGMFDHLPSLEQIEKEMVAAVREIAVKSLRNSQISGPGIQVQSGVADPKALEIFVRVRRRP